MLAQALFPRLAVTGLLWIFLVPAAAAAQTLNVGQTFVGLTNANGGAPPEPTGAVGPNHFVQYTNGSVGIFRKDASTASIVSQSQFWQNVSGVTGVTPLGDPRMLYDPVSGRWFAAAFTAGNDNKLLVARSDTADPTQPWRGFVLNATGGFSAGQFADFPTLGVDARGVYLSVNNFSGATNTHSSLFVIPKADLVQATPTAANTVSVFGTLSRGFAPHGVTDASGSAASGFVGVDYSTIGRPTYAPVTWSGGVPSIGTQTAFSVAGSGSFSGPAPQPSGVNLQGNDDRIQSAVWRQGDLVYTVRGSNLNTRPVAAWAVLNAPAAGGPTLQSSGLIADGSWSFIHPSLAANPRGDVVISFVGTGPGASQFPSVWAVVGTPNTPNSPTNWTFGAPVQVQVGSGSLSSGRIGDYSATSLDPADPGTFWLSVPRTANGGGGNWAAQISEVFPRVVDEIRWATTPTTSTVLSFALASNWHPDTSGTAAAPAAGDHAIFSRSLAAGVGVTIDLPSGTTTNDRLSVRQTGTGNVLFRTPAGGAWNLTNSSTATPSLSVAEYQGTAAASFTGGSLTTQTTVIAGQTTASAGAFTVAGTGTTWNTGTASVFVGGSTSANGGTGSLTVTAGASSTIGGALKLWNSASQVTVSSGGNLTVAQVTNEPGSNPTIAVTGNSSSLRVTGTAATPYSGTVNIDQGGKLDGVGSLGGTVNLNTGGVIQGGTGGADTATNSLTLTSGLVLDGQNFIRVSVADTAPGNGSANGTASRLVLNGPLSRNTGGSTSPSDLTHIQLVLAGSLDYGVIYTVSVVTFPSSQNIILSDLTIDPPTGFLFQDTPSLQLTSTQLFVTFTPAPVPEPVLLLPATFLAFVGVRLVRRKETGVVSTL